MPRDEKHRRAQRRHYLENSEVYKARSAAQKAKRRAWVNEYKDAPCSRCGIQYPPEVMHLHAENGHLDASLSRLVNRRASEAAIRAEAEACTLFCANCHVLHHLERGDFGANTA